MASQDLRPLFKNLKNLLKPNEKSFAARSTPANRPSYRGRPAALALEIIGLGSRVGRQGSSSRLRSAIRKASMPAAAAASMR
jgi:hypothetical protein